MAAGCLFLPTLKADINFKIRTLVPEGAEYWWARAHADVNADGLLDFFVINNNARGGWLAWYETRNEGSSVRHLIAETGPEGGTFAAGDLEAGDIDGDGDIDVLGPVSPGEWGGAGEPTELFWYEQTDSGWKAHHIGSFPNFVKDFDLADLNGDGNLDVAGTCFETYRLLVYRQDNPRNWTKVADVPVKSLHEGQDVGDVDGDGDIDVVSTAFWFENPGGPMTADWRVHNIDPYWNSDEDHAWMYNATKIVCADVDGDGRDEVFISCSERYRTLVAWYDLEPEDNTTWTRKEIGLNDFAHTLQVGDIDLDGDLDVLSGNNGDQADPDYSPVKLFLNPGDPKGRWQETVLTLDGAYNSYLGDLEGDGDLDFFRYRGHADSGYEVWENLTVQAARAEPPLPLDNWRYTAVDENRGRWGDWAEPPWLRYFGLDDGDVNQDGYADIVSGRYIYLNPGPDMTAAWQRIDLGLNTDGALILDIDGDAHGDVISTSLPEVYWLEADDASGHSWKARPIANVPPTGHVNGQGFGKADIVEGGPLEILISAGDGLHMIQVPESPETDPWNAVLLIPQAADEGFATGDIDSDGDIDIAFSGFVEGGDQKSILQLSWWENPGESGTEARVHKLHQSQHDIDRIRIADLDGNGRTDIVYSEERWPGKEPDARLVWLEAPPNPRSSDWKVHLLVTQYSMNNLDVGDIDRDGDIDIVTNEHKGEKLQTQIFENDGKGRFTMLVIDSGKEMHLGAQLADLD